MASRPLEVLDNASATPLGVPAPTDPDEDRLVIQVTGLPRGGSVLVGDRTVLIGDYLTVEQLRSATFRPDGSLTGEAGAFAFMVQDGQGGSAVGSTRVGITASNRPPDIVAAVAVRVTANRIPVSGPRDPDGDDLIVTVREVPERGTVRLAGRKLSSGDRLDPSRLSELTFDVENAAAGSVGRLVLVTEDGRGGRATTEVSIAVDGGSGGDASLSERPRPQPPAQRPESMPALSAADPPSPSSIRVAAAAPESKPASPPEPEGERDGKPNAAANDIVLAARTNPEPPAEEPGKSRTLTEDDASLQDCATCPALVRIPPGTFVMGSAGGDPSERPPRRVTIAKPFALGRYEVTVGEWRACVEDGGCKATPRMSSPSDKTPVHNVHWLEAVAYTGWLSKRTGQRYRLPSEAEWEYAARAGADSRFWWGDKVETGGEMIVACKDCGGVYERLRPPAVDAQPANPFGLHNMYGGVAEWVADCWFGSHAGAPADGAARDAPNCRKRVLRGGSWRDDGASLEATTRNSYDADVGYLTNGFRVALDLE